MAGSVIRQHSVLPPQPRRRSLLRGLLVGVAALAGSPGGFAADGDTVAARVEVEAKADCFVIRFFVRNDGDDDVEAIVGYGGGGKEVATFDLTTGTLSLSITPPVFRRPASRSMRPDIQVFPAGREVLYDTYVLGFPPSEAAGGGGMTAPGEPTLVGHIDLLRANRQPPRLRLRTKPVPFPPAALPKPGR